MEALHKPIFDKVEGEDIFKAISAEVHDLVRNTPHQARRGILKALLFLTLYIGSFICILVYGNLNWALFLFYGICGLTMFLVFLNGFHDAAHNALFKSTGANRRFCS